MNLPVDPGNLPGDLGNPSGDLGGLGGLGGIGGGGSNADPRGQLPVPNVVVVDHAAAVKAVQDHRALPLNDILANTAKTYRGKVIDVELVRTQQKLLYQVKLLDRGTVSLVYFDATNGRAAAAPR